MKDKLSVKNAKDAGEIMKRFIRDQGLSGSIAWTGSSIGNSPSLVSNDSPSTGSVIGKAPVKPKKKATLLGGLLGRKNSKRLNSEVLKLGMFGTGGVG